MVGLKRRILDGILGALDYQAVAGWEADHWAERRFVQKLFHHLRPDCVFDVGANNGQYGSQLRELGFTGTIISFEPVPTTFANLQKRAASDSNWHVLPFALGATEGTAAINVMAKSEFSSFHSPKSDDVSRFEGSNTVISTVEVAVHTLHGLMDQLISEHGFSRPFLKLDTQGFDLQVFIGAGERARQFVGMLSEIAVRTIYHGAPLLTESLDAYRAGGFELAALHAVNPADFGRLVEFNAYFIREDLLPA